MNYIVNPSWFYWINVFEDIKGFATVLLVISVILLVSLIIIAAVNYDLGYKFKEYSEWKIYLKIKKLIPKIVIVTLIIGAIAVFLPSKETLIFMMIAKHATKENLGMTVEGIKSAVDYIMNAIKEIKG